MQVRNNEDKQDQNAGKQANKKKKVFVSLVVLCGFSVVLNVFLLMELKNEEKGSDAYTYEEAFAGSLTTTSQERDLKIRLAFESELNQRLESIDSINKAETTIKIDDEGRESSVLLVLEGTDAMNEDVIEGVVKFVSNSLPNIDEDNISIIDISGRIIY